MSNEMNKALQEELQNISFSEIAGKNTSKDDVTTDLSLYDGRNTKLGYADISWTSCKNKVHAGELSG